MRGTYVSDALEIQKEESATRPNGGNYFHLAQSEYSDRQSLYLEDSADKKVIWILIAARITTQAGCVFRLSPNDFVATRGVSGHIPSGRTVPSGRMNTQCPIWTLRRNLHRMLMYYHVLTSPIAEDSRSPPPRYIIRPDRPYRWWIARRKTSPTIPPRNPNRTRLVHRPSGEYRPKSPHPGELGDRGNEFHPSRYKNTESPVRPTNPAFHPGGFFQREGAKSPAPFPSEDDRAGHYPWRSTSLHPRSGPSRDRKTNVPTARCCIIFAGTP